MLIELPTLVEMRYLYIHRNIMFNAFIHNEMSNLGHLYILDNGLVEKRSNLITLKSSRLEILFRIVSSSNHREVDIIQYAHACL